MFPILFKLISFVPWFLLVGISRIFAYIMMAFNSSQYKVTKNNINHCFGENKSLIKKSFFRTAELIFEYPYVWGRPDNYKKLIEKESAEFNFINEKKPILLFSMHMGCVDTMLFLMSEKLKNLNIIYTPAKNQNLEKITKKIRESKGANMITADSFGIKELYRKFFLGQNIIMASDLVPHKNGIYSEWFGKECLCVDLVEKLSNKGTHALYFVYFSKGTNRKYKFNCKKVESPMSVDKMNEYFEHAIMESPELYGWEYKKFRKLRGENKNIY
tara:strand:- start:828 stop:1643 length:816 start_codon:yes stop_codon:yes gene_type:complete